MENIVNEEAVRISSHDPFGFKEIVSFLEEYIGKHYVKPEKAGNQAAYMEQMRRLGQDARQKYVFFGKALAEQLPGLEYVSCSNWINQGQVVQEYLWIELKNNQWSEYPQSVSINITKLDEQDEFILFIRVDSKDLNSTPEDYKKMLRLLECELLPGMSYYGNDNDGVYHIFGDDVAKVREKCASGEIKKLEVYKAIGNLVEKDTSGVLLQEAIKVTGEIQKLYECVMSEKEWVPDISGNNQKLNEVKQNEVDQFNHNMILYGPPGTGKTYNSVNYAVAICDGRSLQDVKEQPYKETLKRFSELKEKGRVVFTTFHQSYGYEEFIEGIRPVMAKDENAGTLEYEIKDGIFKQLCNAARISEGLEIDHNTSIWFVTLKDGKANDLKTECFRNGEIRFEGTVDLKGDDAWTYERLTGMCRGDYVISNGGKWDLIDAVGIILDEKPFFDESRSSFRWVRKVKWLFTEKQISVKKINSNRLLPRFGIAKMNHMRLSDLLTLVEENGGQSYRENENSYVFIIDEINRGNISKIFGELITLIEDTKRAGASEAMEAILPYSGEPFSVPKNVYILGTMNTADRSIALIDTALSRRFEFVEMMPDPEVLHELEIGEINVKGGGKLDLATMLETINRRIEVLFDREHMIGHAFFTGLYQNVPIEELAKIFEKRIIPLLQEYFYEDYEKIQWVLGDNGKEDEYKFILDQPFKLKNVFKGTPGIDIPQEKIYTIQHDAFLKLESYLQIYE